MKTYKTTWATSLVPSQLSSHSPILNTPGHRANSPTTTSFIKVKHSTYTAVWRIQYIEDGGDPYWPDTKPSKLNRSVNVKVKNLRRKYIIPMPGEHQYILVDAGNEHTQCSINKNIKEIENTRVTSSNVSDDAADE